MYWNYLLSSVHFNVLYLFKDLYYTIQSLPSSLYIASMKLDKTVHKLTDMHNMIQKSKDRRTDKIYQLILLLSERQFHYPYIYN